MSKVIRSWIAKPGRLTMAERYHNATLATDILIAPPFNAGHEADLDDCPLAALLGAMDAESTINPARWEGDKAPYTSGAGYGLLQWTPWTKLRTWCQNNGYPNWEGNGDAQMAKLANEFTTSDPQEKEFFGSATYPTPATFKRFLQPQSDQPWAYSIEEACKVFVYNYLRPANPEGSMSSRIASAKRMLNWLRNDYKPHSADLPIWLLFKFNGRGV